MSHGKGICLECGEPLAYFEEAQEVVCCVCGKKETGRSICTAGHYVCDACHRAGGVDVATELPEHGFEESRLDRTADHGGQGGVP